MVYRTVWSHDIQLPADAATSARARDFVGHHLLEHDMLNLKDDVRLVVSELVTNAVQHAHTSFKVSLHAFEETLLLEVEDGSRTGPVQVVASSTRTDVASPS